MPIYNRAAACNAGRSDDWAQRREADVTRESMHILVAQIREVCRPRAWLFADKETRMAEARLAYFIGDQPAQDKLLGKLTKGCSVCWAPADQLDSTDEVWPLRDSAVLLRSMRRLAAECLNEAGEVMRGKAEKIKAWETENRMRFGSNSLLELIDLGFHATIMMPRDFLHLILLGLFGHHIIKAIIYLIQTFISKAVFCEPHGPRSAPVPESVMKRVMRRLATRLSTVQADESCLTITQKFARHFLKVYEQGKSSFTGPRMMNIMLVLPYILRDLAGPERQAINAAISSASGDDPLHGIPLVDDPCEKIVETLLVFLRWFFLIRRKELSVEDISEAIERGRAMMEALKETFPEKSGEVSLWSFPKFHNVEHIPLWIILFGWVENFSGQAGERAHRELLKSLAGCVNNHEVFLQYLRYWERVEQLARARREAQGNQDTDSLGLGPTSKGEEREEAMHACELGVRCPLLFMARHRSDLHHRAGACKGKHKHEGRQRFNVWHLRDSRTKAVEEVPILRRLPQDLAVFAYMYARRSLDLPEPKDRSGKPSVEDLNNVLLLHLSSDKGGRHLRTFGVLELESERCQGVQRVRCYPFSFDKFKGTNPRQYVGLVPPKQFTGIAFSDFDLGNASHRQKMWVGRVELLFTATFKNALGVEYEFDLAYVSCLYDFEHPSAAGPLQSKAGARMFYVPTTAWTIVLPINHILGRVPLMRLHLNGSTEPTIPHSFSGDKDTYFKYGSADRAGRSGIGSGSLLFELNVHLWQYGRPQPRTMSVRQRLEREEVRLAAAMQARSAARHAKRTRQFEANSRRVRERSSP